MCVICDDDDEDDDDDEIQRQASCDVVQACHKVADVNLK